MKTRKVCIIITFILVVFLISIPNINACLPGNFRDAPGLSKEGGKAIFATIKGLYQSLYLLEDEKVVEANKLWKEKYKFYKQKVVVNYNKVIMKVPDEVIDLKKYKFSQKQIKKINEQIEKVEGEFKISFPKTKKKLAELQFFEVTTFAEFLKSVEFKEDYYHNRDQVRKMNEAITRLLSIGVTISDIASGR